MSTFLWNKQTIFHFLSQSTYNQWPKGIESWHTAAEWSHHTVHCDWPLTRLPPFLIQRINSSTESCSSKVRRTFSLCLINHHHLSWPQFLRFSRLVQSLSRNMGLWTGSTGCRGSPQTSSASGTHALLFTAAVDQHSPIVTMLINKWQLVGSGCLRVQNEAMLPDSRLNWAAVTTRKGSFKVCKIGVSARNNHILSPLGSTHHFQMCQFNYSISEPPPFVMSERGQKLPISGPSTRLLFYKIKQNSKTRNFRLNLGWKPENMKRSLSQDVIPTPLCLHSSSSYDRKQTSCFNQISNIIFWSLCVLPVWH